MPKHASPIDPPGYTAVLEANGKLNAMQAAALVTYAREWMYQAAEVNDQMWTEFRDLYLSARAIFFREWAILRYL